MRSERGRKLREAFVPREPDELGAWCLLAADYSQIELRVMAHLSGDEHMRRAFEEGQDIHAATAMRVFGVLPEMITREHAQPGQGGQLRPALRDGARSASRARPA